MTAPDNRNCVILNDIHIDIMDYIAPASCSDVQVSAYAQARARSGDAAAAASTGTHAGPARGSTEG